MSFLFFALLLGAVQGLAEFLPISSSGHLALFQNFFGDSLSKLDDVTAFSVLLHLGTLIAVFIVYRKDIARMIPAFFTMVKKLVSGKKYKLEDYSYDERMDMLVIIGTLPLVGLYIADILLDRLAGLSILDKMDQYITTQPIVVGVILIFNGLLLFLSDRMARAERPFEKSRLSSGLFIGLCQLCAVLPGLSRSGSTITGGRLMGFSRKDAVRFSFLLSIPAILGSCVAKLPDLAHTEGLSAKDWAVFTAATAVACIVGLCSMKLLNLIAARSTFKGFSFYCFAVGAIAAIAGAVMLF